MEHSVARVAARVPLAQFLTSACLLGQVSFLSLLSFGQFGDVRSQVAALVVPVLAWLLCRVGVSSVDLIIRSFFRLDWFSWPIRGGWSITTQENEASASVRLEGCLDVLLRGSSNRRLERLSTAQKHGVSRWSFHKSYTRERDVQRHPRDLVRVDWPGVPLGSLRVRSLSEVQATRTAAHAR